MPSKVSFVVAGGAKATATAAHRTPDSAFLAFPSFVEALARVALVGFARPFLAKRHPDPAAKVAAVNLFLTVLVIFRGPAGGWTVPMAARIPRHFGSGGVRLGAWAVSLRAIIMPCVKY